MWHSPSRRLAAASGIAIFGLGCADDVNVGNRGGQGGSAGFATLADGAPAGDGDFGGSGAGPGSSDASGGEDGGLLGSETGPTIDPGRGCKSGDVCGDGGVCTGSSVCCAADLACGEECCNAGDICSFQRCHPPGKDCADSTDCADGEYCDYSLDSPSAVDAGALGGSCSGGADVPSGFCVPRPPRCEGDEPTDAGTPLCVQKCEYIPPSKAFDPVVKYEWGAQGTPQHKDVISTPIVLNLDDDDCDGKVTERDIPEIVFVTTDDLSTYAGTIQAISVVGGKVVEKWSAQGGDGLRSPAGGNIDGKPGNEIVVCMANALKSPSTVRAFNGVDGSELWTSPPVSFCSQIAIADLDADGDVEVVVEGATLDGKTGAIEHVITPEMEGTFAVSDIDGDGELDIVSNDRAYHADGMQFIDIGVPTHVYSEAWLGGPAVADLDLDGKPEVIGVLSQQHSLTIWRYDASKAEKFSYVRQAIDINGTLPQTNCPATVYGRTGGGGAVTVGDFDGDGNPDVALAGGVGYAVFDGKKLMDASVAPADTFLWIKDTTDCSSASTGSSIFDFNGDDKAEVVYADELYLKVFDGATGDELFKTCRTSGTASEEVVIADVDNDGQADIVVPANDYFANAGGGYYQKCEGTSQSGIRVFASKSRQWVRTRRIWNEHAYHITNVEEDGTIPTHEKPNWTEPGLDNFRQNKQPGAEHAAPDATVQFVPQCKGAHGVNVVVTNAGEAPLPAGATVTIRTSDGEKIAEVTTTKELPAFGSEKLFVSLDGAPAGVKGGSTAIYAAVGVPEGTNECITFNNETDELVAACREPR